MSTRLALAFAALSVAFCTAGTAIVVWGVSTNANVPTTACATEDAPGPCVWDASERGNRHGRSFYVDASQNVHYLP